MIESVSQAVGLRKFSLSEEESSSSGIHISTVCLLWCSSTQMGISFWSCVKCKQCSKGSPREGCVFVSKIHLVNLHQLLEEEMGSIASNEYHLLGPLPDFCPSLWGNRDLSPRQQWSQTDLASDNSSFHLSALCDTRTFTFALPWVKNT